LLFLNGFCDVYRLHFYPSLLFFGWRSVILRTQQNRAVVFWILIWVWVVVWGLLGFGCACEGRFFNIAVDCLGEFAMLEGFGRIIMLGDYC
jgi:hypothetical protein